MGAPIARLLDQAAELDREPIEVLRVYLGQNARDWANYDQVGDEAHELVARWLRHGGVFPPSPKLEQELQIMKWTMVQRTRSMRKIDVRSATRKKDARAILHRSPDRLDGLRIFAWAASQRGALAVPGDHQPPPPPPDGGDPPDEDPTSEGGALDPYAGAAAWGRL